MPKDARERDILEHLMAIRDQLLLLKMDRSQYIRSQDVMVHYDQVVEQVRHLNEIRKGEKKGENRCTPSYHPVAGPSLERLPDRR